jgi:chaperonin GroES
MMQPKLLKTTVASYVPAIWSGTNTSGHIPLNDNVLIMPDLAATKVGGVLIPTEVNERQDMAAETGVIVAIGPGAFVFDSGYDWVGYKPVPGDRIYMERYAGQLVKGKDGKMYRLMASRCVGSVEHEEPAMQEVA